MVESRSAIFSRDTASKNRAANEGAANAIEGRTAHAAALAAKFRRERFVFPFEGLVIAIFEAPFAFMSMCPKIAAVAGKTPKNNVLLYPLTQP